MTSSSDSIGIDNIQGDVIGVGIDGSGNIIGKNIHIGGGNYIFTQSVKSLEELQNYYRVEPNRLREIQNKELKKIIKWIKDWHELKGKDIERVLLITGEPGIGKSWFAYRVLEDCIKNSYYNIAVITRRQSIDSTIQKEDTKNLNSKEKVVYALDDRGITIKETSSPLTFEDIYEIIKSISFWAYPR